MKLVATVQIAIVLTQAEIASVQAKLYGEPYKLSPDDNERVDNFSHHLNKMGEAQSQIMETLEARSIEVK